ncbi:hypothetical protein [Methanosarcina sp. UBA289]|uniref:hypothetical protein n=1 Tax=Methanosarcina sp. UBA289 TaxID=1915574 RepID=UPI0025D3779A|nr:hypothetical protein [Methanosarcina sp. UBA289]
MVNLSYLEICLLILGNMGAGFYAGTNSPTTLQITIMCYSLWAILHLTKKPAKTEYQEA